MSVQYCDIKKDLRDNIFIQKSVKNSRAILARNVLQNRDSAYTQRAHPNRNLNKIVTGSLNSIIVGESLFKNHSPVAKSIASQVSKSIDTKNMQEIRQSNQHKLEMIEKGTTTDPEPAGQSNGFHGGISMQPRSDQSRKMIQQKPINYKYKNKKDFLNLQFYRDASLAKQNIESIITKNRRFELRQDCLAFKLHEKTELPTDTLDLLVDP